MGNLNETAKPDIFMYHTVDELQKLSLAEVEALWELVPSERQRQYRGIYERFIRNEGVAGSDLMELQAVTQILDKYYVQEYMVPVLPHGEIWVRVPKQVREASSANADTIRPDLEVDNTKTSKRPVVPLAIMGLCMLVFAILFLKNVGGAGKSG